MLVRREMIMPEWIWGVLIDEVTNDCVRDSLRVEEETENLKESNRHGAIRLGNEIRMFSGKI